LMKTILDATMESIISPKEGRTHLIPKPKRNIKPNSREFANVPDDIVSINELVTLIIRIIISYHCLPEFSRYSAVQKNLYRRF
jgi:hypothetical protein